MALTIPDQIVEQTGLSEREFLIECAVHLFDRGKLSAMHAARLAEMNRMEFWEELIRRGIPRFNYSEEDLQQDLASLARMDKG